MIFTSKKTENCFADSQTYEYALPVSGEEFRALLPADWAIRLNTKLRRPVFVAERDGVNIKGVLALSTIRVSFPDERWESEKRAFEEWLEGLNE